MKKQSVKCEDCLFCSKYGRTPIHKISFASLLNRALYTKYSQNKVRKFEDFFSSKPIKWVIDFKDAMCYEDKDEFLKRFYPKKDQPMKFDQLLEYYKYHKDIPRMFIYQVADLAIYFYEKKKQIEYKRIKIMLGIPVEQSSTMTQEEEKLKEEMQVLNEMTQQTETSVQNVLKQLVAQSDQEKINIDATWLTMSQDQQQQQTHTNTNTHLAPNLQLLKKLISKNSKAAAQNQIKMPFSVYSNKIKEKNNSPLLQINLHSIAKDNSQKSIKVNHQQESDYQRFLKQQIIATNHYNACKSKPIQPSYSQSKQNSCHHITSTRSISQEQLKLSQIKKANHKKSQTHYTDIGSPCRKDSKQKSQKLYTNMGESRNKSQEKLFKIYTSTPGSTNINININQLNMNNLNLKSPFQQYKAMLESPKHSNKKKNSITSASQRQFNSSSGQKVQNYSSSQKKQISTIIIEKIKSSRKTLKHL